MIQLSNQQLFDNALFGLRKQGKACVADDNSQCLYRDNGNRCAVGFSIDDRHYAEDIEATSLETLIEGGEFPIFPAEQHDLLSNLQCAHDGNFKHHGILSWEIRMRHIAEDHHLKYTEPKE